MKLLEFNDLFSKIYQVAKIASFQNFTFFDFRALWSSVPISLLEICMYNG